MCGNNMSVPLLANAVTLSGTEKETAVVGDHESSDVFSTAFLVMFCYRRPFFVDGENVLVLKTGWND